MKCYKILKIKNIFKNYGMRNLWIFQNSLVWKIMREDVNFLSISEKCSNSYKYYKKNFHQGIVNNFYSDNENSNQRKKLWRLDIT